METIDSDIQRTRYLLEKKNVISSGNVSDISYVVSFPIGILCIPFSSHKTFIIGHGPSTKSIKYE